MSHWKCFFFVLKRHLMRKIDDDQPHTQQDKLVSMMMIKTFRFGFFILQVCFFSLSFDNSLFLIMYSYLMASDWCNMTTQHQIDTDKQKLRNSTTLLSYKMKKKHTKEVWLKTYCLRAPFLLKLNTLNGIAMLFFPFNMNGNAIPNSVGH